jgi:protein gp37
MSDLFHEDIPFHFIERVFATMAQASWHQFQILTKRAERLAMLAPSLPWSANIWQGVSVEDTRHVWRIDYLTRVPARVRFVSAEPLLGAIPDLPLEGIHWVIVGGESGPGHRQVNADWVRQIRDRCRAGGVSFFFKQWGGRTSKAGGRTLDGRVWSQMPGSSPTAP